MVVFFCVCLFVCFYSRCCCGFHKEHGKVRQVLQCHRLSQDGWINCSVRRPFSVPDNFLKCSHYVAIWPIPPRRFCTVRGWSSPTIVPCWKAHKHTHIHTHTVGHKLNLWLRLVTSKDLFTENHQYSERQWKLEMRVTWSCSRKPAACFKQMWTSDGFHLSGVIGDLVNEPLSIIYLLWEQRCEPRTDTSSACLSCYQT